MSKLIAVLVASLFATVAVAQQQTPGVPPVVPAAGTTSSTGASKSTTSASTDTTATSDKKAARTARAKARHAKRDAKVGDKPVN